MWVGAGATLSLDVGGQVEPSGSGVYINWISTLIVYIYLFGIKKYIYLIFFPYVLLLFLLIYYQVENQIIVNRKPTHGKFC